MNFNDDFFDELGRSPGVTNLVQSITEDVAAIARADAPVGETEEYRDGIQVVMKQQRRSVGLVRATDEKSMLVESKTGNLARALRKARRRG